MSGLWEGWAGGGGVSLGVQREPGVLGLLSSEVEVAYLEIGRLNDSIAEAEGNLERDRLRLAELEIRVVELRTSAGILRDRNLRVERGPDGITVTVDPA